MGIGAVGFLVKKMEKNIAKHEKKCLSIFLSIFFILLYVVSCVSRNTPMYDYNDIYTSAYGYAYGGAVDWSYFSHWSNNFPIFFLLTTVMKFCSLLGIAEPFYVLLFLNCMLSVWTGYCLFGLVKGQTQSVGWGFYTLLLYVAFVPIWGGTNYFYTDSLSLSFGIWAAYILYKHEKNILSYIFAGFLWGIGYGIKATVAISLVAVLMIYWLTASKNKLKVSIVTGIAFLCTVFMWSALRSGYPCYEDESKYGAPITYWLALGIHNDGSYPGNIDFAVQCLETPGKEAKNELACNYMKEHISDLWSLEHITSKMQYNFASGKMGLSEFNQYPTTFMHELVNDYGKYGGYATMFCSGYFYALLIWGLMGYAVVVWKKIRTDQDKLLMVCQYTVFGLFFFLMIWESNNRQLYNHIGWFALYGSMGLYRIIKK